MTESNKEIAFCKQCQRLVDQTHHQDHQNLIKEEDFFQDLKDFQESLRKDKFFKFMESINCAQQKVQFILNKYKTLQDAYEQLQKLQNFEFSTDQSSDKIELINQFIQQENVPIKFDLENGFQYDKQQIKLLLDKFVQNEKTRLEKLYDNIYDVINIFQILNKEDQKIQPIPLVFMQYQNEDNNSEQSQEQQKEIIKKSDDNTNPSTSITPVQFNQYKTNSSSKKSFTKHQQSNKKSQPQVNTTQQLYQFQNQNYQQLFNELNNSQFQQQQQQTPQLYQQKQIFTNQQIQQQQQIPQQQQQQQQQLIQQPSLVLQNNLNNLLQINPAKTVFKTLDQVQKDQNKKKKIMSILDQYNNSFSHEAEHNSNNFQTNQNQQQQQQKQLHQAVQNKKIKNVSQSKSNEQGFQQDSDDSYHLKVEDRAHKQKQKPEKLKGIYQKAIRKTEFIPRQQLHSRSSSPSDKRSYKKFSRDDMLKFLKIANQYKQQGYKFKDIAPKLNLTVDQLIRIRKKVQKSKNSIKQEEEVEEEESI